MNVSSWECDKEENVEVTADAATSCFGRIKRFVQWHVFDQSPPDGRPSDTLHTLHRSKFVQKFIIHIIIW